jgi:hypothetical protein
VPGAQIYEGSARIRGWTVGNSPRIQLLRRGKIVLTRKIRSAPDGTFQLELHKAGKLMLLRPGDLLRIGSRTHPRLVTLPTLQVALQSGTHTVRFSGPPRTPLMLTVTRSNGRTAVETLRTGSSGEGTTALSDGSLSLGDVATLKLTSSTGDQIYAQGQTRGILVREGFATVSGTVSAGAVLSIHVLSSSGAALGGAVTAADRETGDFSAKLRTKSGEAVRVKPGMQLLVRDGSLDTSTVMPFLQVSRAGANIVSRAVARAHQSGTWTGIDARGKSMVRPLRANARGVMEDRFHLPTSSHQLDRVDLTIAAGDGVTVQRVLVLAKGAIHHVSVKASVKMPACTAPNASRGRQSVRKGTKCQGTGRTSG